jgi:hypothetical protein
MIVTVTMIVTVRSMRSMRGGFISRSRGPLHCDHDCDYDRESCACQRLPPSVELEQEQA